MTFAGASMFDVTQRMQHFTQRNTKKVLDATIASNDAMARHDQNLYYCDECFTILSTLPGRTLFSYLLRVIKALRQTVAILVAIPVCDRLH